MTQKDCQFDHVQYELSELRHHYGSNVHLLSHPVLLSQLARLCTKECQQPLINELIVRIYESLVRLVLNSEFPVQATEMKTRMAEFHPEGVFRGPVIDPNTKTISVNLARAGTLPSQVVFSQLNYLLNPEQVRQDHIIIGRKTDKNERVVGTEVTGQKIGGSPEGATILFPDPMGATGSTILHALDLYESMGKAKKCIALHCIVTPEYLRAVRKKHPQLIIYAVRLDRGLSAPDVLSTPLGERWDEEKGLDDRSYIVPGGGGFGEILNNAYV